MAKPRDDEAFEDDERRPRPVRPHPPRPPRRDEDFEEDARPRRRPEPRDDDDRRRDDRYDDDYRRPRRRDDEGSAIEGSSIIPTQNIFALLGYYFAFGSLIVILGTFALLYYPMFANHNPGVYVFLMFGVGGILAVIAIAFGIVGMVKVSHNPRVKGTAHAIIAMIMGIGEIVALLILLLIGFATKR